MWKPGVHRLLLWKIHGKITMFSMGTMELFNDPEGFQLTAGCHLDVSVGDKDAKESFRSMDIYRSISSIFGKNHL